MDTKFYMKVLTEHAERHHRPHENALNDFLDFAIGMFDIKAMDGDFSHYQKWICDKFSSDGDFSMLVFQWLSDVACAMEKGEWLDAFGILYEEMFLTRGKASSTGQFFTPPSLSNLMAKILKQNNADGNRINDCAAGSGRLLLAHYIDNTKEDHAAGRKFTYIAQDVDSIACKMCALNLMAHGMYGRVICQNTLTLDTPSVVYHINEACYPISTPYRSIRCDHPKD